MTKVVNNFNNNFVGRLKGCPHFKDLMSSEEQAEDLPPFTQASVMFLYWNTGPSLCPAQHSGGFVGVCPVSPPVLSGHEEGI